MTLAQFPDANCTGVLPGITRTSQSGTLTTTSHGQVIQNLNLNGHIIVSHNNVTIRNVKITNPQTGGNGVAISTAACGSCTGTLIEDVELDGTGNTGGASAVDYKNYTLRRMNMHHYGEGGGMDGGVLIEDSYVHTFIDHSGSGAHQDGIAQGEFTGGNIVRHNRCNFTFVSGSNANACLVFGGDTVNNIAEKNLFYSPWFALYPGDNGGSIGMIRYNRWTTSLTEHEVYDGYPGGMDNSGINRWCDNKFFDGPSAGLTIGSFRWEQRIRRRVPRRPRPRLMQPTPSGRDFMRPATFVQRLWWAAMVKAFGVNLRGLTQDRHTTREASWRLAASEGR